MGDVLFFTWMDPKFMPTDKETKVVGTSEGLDGTVCTIGCVCINTYV